MHLRQLKCITKRAKKSSELESKRCVKNRDLRNRRRHVPSCADVKSSLALRQRDANELVKTDTICEDMQMHREGITNTPES